MVGVGKDDFGDERFFFVREERFDRANRPYRHKGRRLDATMKKLDRSPTGETLFILVSDTKFEQIFTSFRR